MGSFILAETGEADFMIHGIFSYEIFGQTVWITQTHVSTLIVMLILIIFGIVCRVKIRNVKPDDKPSTFISVCELIVEKLDGMVEDSMGSKHYRAFANYIGTIFGFILLSNVSGLLGLRPPTADYGVTFPLAIITFCLITFNKFKYQKPIGVLKGLMDPWPFWLPINLVGDFAVPVSLSLRLFANVLSGTAIMALVYAMLSKFAIIWPAALHFYFDLFSGAIQTYVFAMLTMTYISDAIGEDN